VLQSLRKPKTGSAAPQLASADAYIADKVLAWPCAVHCLHQPAPVHMEQVGITDAPGASGYADRQPLGYQVPPAAEQVPASQTRACVCHLGRIHGRPWGRRR